jgi:lysophospholipase L1-like esterase
MQQEKLTYLALGDSYTIGEGVDASQRWPVQLAQRRGWVQPHIIATTGWTTFELLDAIDHATLAKSYDRISLLIGVNNQYRGLAVQAYRDDLEKLAERMLPIVNGKAQHIFLLSIPDYSVTPFAREKQPEKIAEEIFLYNQVKEAFARERGFQYVYITDLSLKAAIQNDLLVEDQLHPSGLQYQQWVDRIEQRCQL